MNSSWTCYPKSPGWYLRVPSTKRPFDGRVVQLLRVQDAEPPEGAKFPPGITGIPPIYLDLMIFCGEAVSTEHYGDALDIWLRLPSIDSFLDGKDEDEDD